MIYLDNAATTQIAPEVFDAMKPYLTEQYGNPGAVYSIGRTARDAIQKAREQVAGLINCTPEQIIFTSGGSEASNLVFSGVSDFLERNNQTHIITSKIEHDSVQKAAFFLTKRGFELTKVAPNECGEVKIENISSQFNRFPNPTGLVSIMHTNNETGVVNNVSEIGKVCSANGILFHTDCVQAAGSSVLDVGEIHCDFLSLSSHKIHGPKGMGALFVKDSRCLMPMIHGGTHQEFGLRGGTENVAGIVGFGAACELQRTHLKENISYISILNHRMCKELQHAMNIFGIGDKMHINGSAKTEHSMFGKVLNVRFDGVDSETLLLMLDSQGVCVSAGSACQAHESKPSAVLMEMGLTEEEARSSIRISFSTTNTLQEIITAAGIIANCVNILRLERGIGCE